MNYETYAKINLDNLISNIKNLKQYIGFAEILAVLKADAYAHKSTEIYKTLIEIGIKSFAVANLTEAIELKKIDKTKDIMVFGNINPIRIKEAIDNKIIFTIFSKEFYKTLKPYIETEKIRAHIKVNTGFNRLGFDLSDDSLDIIKEISDNRNVSLEGIYSHLALTDEESDNKQIELFNHFIKQLEEKGVTFKLKHIADSIAAIKYPHARLDMVRLGAVMYGLKANYPCYDEIPLKSTFKLYSTVSQIRSIKKGEGISYDYTFIADYDMKIATLAFGYADGYPRNLSNKGFVLINGKKAKILGLICMDQCVVDITNIENVNVNDNVLLYDIDSESPVSLATLSILAKTNKNDILASLGKRVTRIYTKAGSTYTVV